MDRQGSGLRQLTGLLLALNLGVLALGIAMALWPQADKGGESFNSEKIRLLGLAEPAKPGEPAPSQVGEELPAAGPTPQPAEPTAGPALAPPNKESEQAEERSAAVAPDQSAGTGCLAWKAFDQRHFDKMVSLLAKRGFKEDSYDIRLDKSLGWWVYTAPFPNQETAQAALKDVQAKKVKSALVVKSGELKNALSLGAFPDRRRAQEHVRALTAKGIKGLQYGPRRIEPSAVLRIKQPLEAKAWAELAQELEASAKSESECTGKG